ncbi:MAG TPA: multicopper oxidase domain-containing protein, partial [Thermoanaerobaculia bacterium]|nr:multicopper oxidase domain-containing protein [Thermoanaerobaculia bacterium]
TIVILPPNTVPMPAEPWDTSSAFVVSGVVRYACLDHPKETGRIAIKLVALLIAFFAAAFFASSLHAQTPPTCANLIGGELMPIPTIDRDDIKNQVRGTLVTSGEKQLIAFIKPPRVTGEIRKENLTCVPQWVRTYRKDAPATSQAADAPVTLPQPGPIIRARVGDLVEMTFLNLIDPLNFPNTDTGKCDEVQNDAGPVYPQTDTFPNCFHGSVFTNVHYHGTHTSPNSTGDNVFLEVVPSPRARNAARTPAVTAESVKADFAKFFGDCESHLNLDDSPQQWPKIWTDLPENYRTTQDKLLLENQKVLYDANQSAKANGAFPQNYVGAFPYCYRLPVYTSTKFPPESFVEERTAHTEGAGSTEHDESLNPRRKLLMGQAPGTHWYHAHKHGSTTLNVSNGMTGVMIVEGVYDDEIAAAYKAAGGIKEKVIVINQIGVTPKREGGSEQQQGPYLSVNGRLQPTITMQPGEVQMWRIANTSSRSGALFFEVPAGVTWRQLAQDGVQFTDDNYKNSENKGFLLASGNRADLLVKAPARKNATLPLTVTSTTGPSRNNNQVLLNVMTGDTARDMPLMDRKDAFFPPFLTNIQDKEITGHKTLVFRTERDPNAPRFATHSIDGRQFSGEVGALVLLNQIEEWKIVNESYGNEAIAHPFHIHINPFQVVEVFDPNEKLEDGTTPRYTTGTPGEKQCRIDVNDPSTWKPCANVPAPRDNWWDVFPIPAGNTFNNVKVPGYFKLRSRFVDYSGYYVIHCHILAHE